MTSSLKMRIKVEDDSDGPSTLFVFLGQIKITDFRVHTLFLGLILQIGVGSREINRQGPQKSEPRIGLFILFHNGSNLKIIQPGIVFFEPLRWIAWP